MRAEIIIALVVGALFFFASAAMTALAITYATNTAFWDVVLVAGIVGMIGSILTLILFLSHHSTGRPWVWSSFLINLGICLIVGGVLLHFSPTANSILISNNPYAKFTNTELREKIFLFATQLRNFEADYDRMRDEARNRLQRDTQLPIVTEDQIARQTQLFKQMQEEIQNITRKKQTEYSNRFRSDAKLLFEALLIQLKLTYGNDNTHSPFATFARAAIETGRLAGRPLLPTLQIIWKLWLSAYSQCIFS